MARSVLLAALVALTAAGCSNPMAELDEPREVGLHFQSQFVGDAVDVELDGEPLYSDTVSTHAVLGVAHMTSIMFTSTRHQVRVTVNDGASAEVTVDARKAVVVVVRYDRGNDEVQLSVSNRSIYYY